MAHQSRELPKSKSTQPRSEPDGSPCILFLQRLKEGKKVDVPIYNFVTHRREEKTMSMYGANVLIFEGILSFHNKQV